MTTGAVGQLSPDQTVFAQQVVVNSGLPPAVVTAWIGAESGWNVTKAGHNYLNIGPGRSYGSAHDAGIATSQLINTSGYYKGIRASVASNGVNSDPNGVVAAIVASPWDAGHYSGLRIGNATGLAAFQALVKQVSGAIGPITGSEGTAAGTGITGFGNTVGDVAGAVPGVSSLADVFAVIGRAAAWVGNPKNWLRIIEVIGGGVGIVVALVILSGKAQEVTEAGAKVALLA